MATQNESSLGHINRRSKVNVHKSTAAISSRQL